MKPIFLLLTFLCLFASCNKIERGTPDTDTSARKLFDTFRVDDQDKSNYLLPDKGTYRKIEEQKGKVLADLNASYAEFTDKANSNFNTVRQQVSNWEKCTYLHSIKEEAKVGKLPAAIVTAKFEVSGTPYKFKFTSIKFNNRWYYMGDVEWVPKSNL